MATKRAKRQDYQAAAYAEAMRVKRGIPPPHNADHLCGICGLKYSPFGFNPPAIAKGQEWRCLKHRFMVGNEWRNRLSVLLDEGELLDLIAYGAGLK